MTHLTFEQINDIADGRLPAADGDSHLATCAECQDTLSRVRTLIVAAHKLPRDIVPPPEIWTSLRTRVARVPASRSTLSRWRLGWMASAAAIIFIAGVALLMPRDGARVKGAKAIPSTTAVVAPAMHLAVEANYAGTVAELRRTLDSQRATLTPATLRVLERSLATIDTAIAEARGALASDPGNQMLVTILSANYQHKVKLLQRATELSPST